MNNLLVCDAGQELGNLGPRAGAGGAGGKACGERWPRQPGGTALPCPRPRCPMLLPSRSALLHADKRCQPPTGVRVRLLNFHSRGKRARHGLLPDKAVSLRALWRTRRGV